jgi:hypothetical protein
MDQQIGAYATRMQASALTRWPASMVLVNAHKYLQWSHTVAIRRSQHKWFAGRCYVIFSFAVQKERYQATAACSHHNIHRPSLTCFAAWLLMSPDVARDAAARSRQPCSCSASVGRVDTRVLGCK